MSEAGGDRRGDRETLEAAQAHEFIHARNCRAITQTASTIGMAGEISSSVRASAGLHGLRERDRADQHHRVQPASPQNSSRRYFWLASRSFIVVSRCRSVKDA